MEKTSQYYFMVFFQFFYSFSQIFIISFLFDMFAAIDSIYHYIRFYLLIEMMDAIFVNMNHSLGFILLKIHSIECTLTFSKIFFNHPFPIQSLI